MSIKDEKNNNADKAKLPDYGSENERRRRAVDKENKFLKDYVMDEGSYSELEKQNMQTGIEKNSEKA
jgi:hypothetical protein